MRKSFFPALILLASLPAQAGVVIVSETTGKDATGQPLPRTVTTTTIDGNRQRSESTDQIMIIDADKDLVLTLIPGKKTYRRASIKEGPLALGAAAVAQMKYQPKGTKQSSAGTTCEDYAVDMSGITQIQCIAKSGPGAAESIAFNRKVMQAAGAKMPAGIPEGVMLVVETRADPIVTRTAVTSIRTQSVPAGTFEVPAGYQQDTTPDPAAEFFKQMQSGNAPKK